MGTNEATKETTMDRKPMPITKAEYKAYEKAINAAAGTDIRILECGWIQAVKDEDWATARRLEAIVKNARTLGGY